MNSAPFPSDPAGAVRRRTSVRTFDGDPLGAADREFLDGALYLLSEDRAPFGGQARFTLIETDAAPKAVGTYGVVRGASLYIAAAALPVPDALTGIGYRLERLVLALAERGIGSCWLAGTFDRTALSGSLELGEREIPAVLMPVGYPAGRRHLQAGAVRLIAGSSRRKPFEKLFFDRGGLPLNVTAVEERGGRALLGALEAARLAPSASNKQPWRIVVDPENGELSLYLDRDPRYEKMLPFPVQSIDMGIAMAHLELFLPSFPWEREERPAKERSWEPFARRRFR